MNAALALREAARPIVGVHPDLDSASPLDCLQEGKQWACDSFVEWAREEKGGQELYDMLLSTTPGLSISGMREAWSKAVLKGEWA
ncbi:hypothetical protein ACT3S5_00580 [Halomonas sp. AOP31-B1-25]|uniref:hypothetical protein n=1 Tax=Halomonas sp. AOP31-B1-25 TaxID=3457694 RepID=UPI004033728B